MRKRPRMDWDCARHSNVYRVSVESEEAQKSLWGIQPSLLIVLSPIGTPQEVAVGTGQVPTRAA